MVDTEKTSAAEEAQEKNGSKEHFYERLTLFDVTFDPGMKDHDGNEIPRPFTRNLMKKWLRKVKWESHKAQKRAKEKARVKERRKLAREANIDLGPSRKALKKMREEKPKIDMGIVIDLSFVDLMIEKDRFKVMKQILRCYSINRRSNTPVQFYITSFGGKSKADMARHNGYEHWDIKFHEEAYIDIFPKDKLVYLTSESDNVIEEFEKDTVYIIGGLVDHNQHKGLCYSTAQAQGIRHAQLPLAKYVNMKTRKVLTIDHVFEIILKVCEGVSWQQTLIEVLPTRKGAHAAEVDNTSDNSEDSFE